jgi:hypothetical protein
MNTAQVGGLVIVVLSAVVSFALLPQPDITIPPMVKFALGIANVALTTLALYLKVQMPGSKA